MVTAILTPNESNAKTRLATAIPLKGIYLKANKNNART
jgi:hypothetical protein